MSAKFMLLYDKDRDLVFVDLQTGALQWILPSSDSISNLLHTTHLTETGQAYYEDLKSGAVTWTLPTMSAAALAAAKFVQESHRPALEQRIGSPFSAEASTAQFSAIDDYLAYQDELKANGVAVDNADEDDGSDDEIVRDSSFLNERPSKAVVMRTVQQIKNAKLKTGYLNKLATQSGRNWKKRFFVLTPLNLAYYVSDDPGQKPKGELQILADGTVSEEKVDSKQGLGLRFNNGAESIVVAAASDVDRSHWLQALRAAIAGADRILRATVTVLGDSTVLINSRSAFSLGAKTAKRFVVFADGVVTVHPDAATTTTIDGVLNVNAQTKLKVANERDRVLTLVDSDFKSTTLSLRFDCDPSRDPTTFLLWRRAIDAAMDDDDDDDDVGGNGRAARPGSARSVSSNSTTTSRRSVAAPGGGGGSSGASIAAATAAAAAAANDTTPARPLSMPAHVGVFGLSFDDDNEDDDDDDARSSVSSAPAAAAAPAASKATAAATAAAPEAATPAVAAASTKLSALNRGARSFLRKRASKTPTTPVAPAAPQTLQATPPPPPPPKAAATAAAPPPPPQSSQAVANPLAARRAAAPPVAAAAVAAPVVHDDDDESGAFGAAAAANAFLLSNVDDDDDDDGGRVPPQSNPLRAPPVAAAAAQPPPPPTTTTTTTSKPPPPATQPAHAATALPGHHHAHPAAASAVSPLHSAAQTASLRELVGDAEAQSIARVVEAALPSPTASLATTQQLTSRPVRDFLAQTRRVEDAVLQQLDRADRDRAAWATGGGGGSDDADAAMRKLRAMLRDSLQAASAAEKTNSAFQQLEQEKALLVQLLDHVQRTETLALQQIQRQETDALARIRDEAAHVQSLFEAAQDELCTARATHEAEMERRLALLEQAKTFLDAEQRRLDDDFRAKMRDVALIARDLAAQHARLQLDRKKMLKSRYQLDLAVQDALRVAAATATAAGYYPAEETKRAYASPNVSPVSTRGRSATAAVPSSSAAARAAGAVRSASPASSSVHSVASGGGGGGGGYYAAGAGTMRTQPLPRDRSQSPAAGDYAAFRHTSTAGGGGGSRATTPTSIAAQPRRQQQPPQQQQQPQPPYPSQWAPLRQQPPPYAVPPPPDAYGGDGFASPAAPAPPSSSAAAAAAAAAAAFSSAGAAVPPVLTGLNTIMSRLRSQQQQLMPQLAPPATHQHPLRHHTTTGAYQRQAPPPQQPQPSQYAAYPPPQQYAPPGYYYAAAPPPGHGSGYAPPPAYAMPMGRYGR